MTTTIADDKHYSAVARQHSMSPDAFVCAAVKGERAMSTDRPDIVAAGGKGVPAKVVASKVGAKTAKGC